MNTNRSLLAASLAALLTPAAPLPAAPGDVIFTIDPTQSSVSATLALSILGSDTDASPLSGTISANTDCAAAPLEATLLDFSIVADQEIVFSLGNVITGAFDASITDTAVSYAGLAPVGPVAANPAGTFAFPAVPANQTGTGSYAATGLICAALQGQPVPLPCVDSFALDEEGTTVIDPLGVTITETAPGQYQLAGSLSISRELDPDNPGLGTFTFAASVVATGTVEPCVVCQGDSTGDGSVDTADLLEVLANFNGSVGGGASEGDFDGSGVVDTADLLIVLANFNTACGE